MDRGGRAREPGLPDLDFDAILAENGRLILGASGKPCFSTQVSRFDGTTWSADKIAPSSDGICSLPATRHGSPTAILVDGMQGVMGTGMGLLITDPSGEWVPLVEDSPVLGLAGTPSDFWAVGTSIRHYVDRTAVEQVR